MRHLTRGALLLWLLSIATVSVARNGFNVGGTPKKPFRFYHGPAKPKEEVAILKSPNFALGDHKSPLRQVIIYLREINGKPGWSKRDGYNSLANRGFYIELLPGAYTLGVRYYYSGMLYEARSDINQTISFTAEAGHEYLLSAKAKGETWQPALDDETAGTRIHP